MAAKTRGGRRQLVQRKRGAGTVEGKQRPIRGGNAPDFQADFEGQVARGGGGEELYQDSYQYMSAV